MEIQRTFHLCERKNSLNSSQLLYLHVAELLIAEDPLVISTILGSCVSVCLYCPEKKMGGMNHFALPSEHYTGKKHDSMGRNLDDSMNLGSISIPVLIEELCRRTKTSYGSLQAKIVGGAAVMEELKQSSEIGALNIAIAKEILKKFGIPIIASDVGGSTGRKVLFHTDTGRLRVAPITANNILEQELEKAPEVAQAKTADHIKKPSSRKKVLIVDDSRTIRNLLTKIFSQDPSLEVVGAAADAMEAEKLITKLKPDVMTLDIHMPQIDGVAFLEKLLPKKPMPVVMITSLNIAESSAVMRALELGAVDYIQKPTFSEISSISTMMCEKVRLAADAKIRVRREVEINTKNTTYNEAHIDKSIIIAMGASTGGTEALKDVLVKLPQDIPPILIVQHIPALFSKTFADRLNELCAFEVKEAENGDIVKPGRALVAPGGFQMKVVRKSNGLCVEINDAAPVNRHKPSVDYLFDSVATNIGKKAVGIILTGMGDDGARGLLKMRTAGAHSIAQNEESCVVFGMPKEAIRLGAVELISPLDDIPTHLMSLIMNKHSYKKESA